MTVTCRSGWHPDLPDPRDYTPLHEQIEPLLRTLPALGSPPSHADWRSYCSPCRQVAGVHERTGSVHVCVDLLEQYELRVNGRRLTLSQPFVHCTAHRLAQTQGIPPLSLRAVWKAIVQYGVPPLDVWPGQEAAGDDEPDAFAYQSARRYSELRYVRLDSRGQSGSETLDRVRSFLSAGFLCVFGAPLCTSTGEDGEIGYPTVFDDVRGGHALMAVGYDDRRRIRSDRGCLAVRGGWGPQWGEEGYGWLPYTYVREKLAADFWTIFAPDWFQSGEFRCPTSDAE